MTAYDDGELWTRAQSGDSTAFGVLFDRHANAIYTYCFRRTGDWALAEDMMSIVFLEAWRRRREVELPAKAVMPWLYGVATNLLRNHRRSLRRYRTALNRLPRPESEPDFADDLASRLSDERQMHEILAEVRGLPKRQQDVLALCVWQELTRAEAAAALGVRETTIRTRLLRARNRLRGIADSKALKSRLEGKELG